MNLKTIKPFVLALQARTAEVEADRVKLAAATTRLKELEREKEDADRDVRREEQTHRSSRLESLIAPKAAGAATKGKSPLERARERVAALVEDVEILRSGLASLQRAVQTGTADVKSAHVALLDAIDAEAWADFAPALQAFCERYAAPLQRVSALTQDRLGTMDYASPARQAAYEEKASVQIGRDGGGWVIRAGNLGGSPDVSGRAEWLAQIIADATAAPEDAPGLAA